MIQYTLLVVALILTRAVEKSVDETEDPRSKLHGWFPYDPLKNRLIFKLSNLQQVIPAVVLSSSYLIADNIFIGFLIQTKYQLLILRQRLRNFDGEDIIEPIKCHQKALE